MKKSRTAIFTVITLIWILILSSGCNKPNEEKPPVINKDLCDNIECPNVCKGEDLWSQKCLDGNCVDFVRVESCSEKCGCIVDLCQRVQVISPLQYVRGPQDHAGAEAQSRRQQA